ncbi:hypothetical protein LL946_06335 [Knoellia locipacati]|uniref:hypothetical protein n=1 Tax=Knoellia locipacati TaxID=882824 RepID=UPI003850DFD3
MTSLQELSPEALRNFEVWVSRRHPSLGFRYLAATWMVLRRVKSDLREDTARFVRHAPNVRGRESLPTEALSDDVMRKVLRAAKGDVARARRRLEGRPGHMAWGESVSLFVLLLWELDWSMDVLKALQFRPDSPTTVLDWSAGDGTFVETIWLKARGGASQQRLYRADGPWSPGTLLRCLETFTRSAREVGDRADNDFTSGCPWLAVVDSPSGFGDRLPVEGGWLVRTFDGHGQFRRWLTLHGIATPEAVGERVTFRAIRPAAKAVRMSLTDTSGLHVADIVDGHTAEVFQRRYTRNARLMRELAQIWHKEIAGRAEGLIRGWRPHIVTEEAGSLASGLDATTARSALDGDLEAGLVACLDPLDSPQPGQRRGHPCGLAFRACFECPNAVVTPRHVTRLRQMLDLAGKRRLAMSPIEWEALWSGTVAFIHSALEVLEPLAPNYEQLLGPPPDLGVGPSGGNP